jgi:hypothetical protein
MTTTTTTKQEGLHAEIESAWEVETSTLRQTIRLYFPPISLRHRPRAQRPGRVKVYTEEEILNFAKSLGGQN